MSERALARLSGRAVLRLRGQDVTEFLQGLVTVDLRLLTLERSLWGALLTPQGRYLCDFFLIQEAADCVLLDCEMQQAPALMQRLTFYRLRRKIDIVDATAEWAVVAIAAAPADLGLTSAQGATRRLLAAIVFIDPRLVALGARALVPPATVDAFAASLKAQMVPARQFVERRLALGVPEGATDLIPERSLPLECNFAELGGVSFTKGCFVGQEVTARMHFRARPRRRLLPVRIEGNGVEAGAEVRTADGREAGILQRVEGELGLALLRIEHLFRPEAQPFVAGGARILWWLPDWLPIQEKKPLQTPETEP